MPREVALNKASDYLKIAVVWLKLLKCACNKCISRKVTGFFGVKLTIYFLCGSIFQKFFHTLGRRYTFKQDL